jgi:hypothetical protein
MNPAPCYVRFSPRNRSKKDNCPSLEIQFARVEKYANFAELDITACHMDPWVSARKTALDERPGGRALLAELGYVATSCQCCGAQTWKYRLSDDSPRDLVAYDVSRVFRDMSDGLRWLERWGRDGISLHTANGIVADASRADGFLVVGVQLLMSAYAPRKTAERTSDALLHRQAGGQLVCRPDRIPYGQRLVRKGRLADVPEERAHIAMIRDQNGGGASPPEICASLRARGCKYRGTEWNPTRVRQILKRLAKR